MHTCCQFNDVQQSRQYQNLTSLCDCLTIFEANVYLVNFRTIVGSRCVVTSCVGVGMLLSLLGTLNRNTYLMFKPCDLMIKKIFTVSTEFCMDYVQDNSMLLLNIIIFRRFCGWLARVIPTVVLMCLLISGCYND